MTAASNDIVISVRDLTLEYRVYQYRASTFKEFVMNRLRGRNAHKVIRALDHVEFDVRRGESVALIGHNGCGKSTLLKCLAGIYLPQGAQINVHGRIAPMIELGTGFDGELSGFENIKLSCMLMGLTSDEVAARVNAIIDFSELREFIHIPFKNYSSGMQARLGFACATAVDPDILLVDEVLAVGDSNFARKCLDRIHELKSRGATVVLVSHDPGVVQTFCDRGIVFSRGQMKFDGPVLEALAAHQEIMDQRYLETLSEADRREALRIRELHCNAGGVSGSSARPRAQASFQVVQGGAIQEEIDPGRPFEIAFRVTFERADLLEGDVSVGFGINALSGQRIGGFNNLKAGSVISREALARTGRADVRFIFERGVPELSTGSYRLICGVHDRGITRDLFTATVGHLKVVNSLSGINVDGDIIAFDRYVSRVALQV